MAIRPVDLQQVLTKLPDIGRDSATQQQQPLAAQHLLASEDAKRRQERAETVKSFEDEAGLAAVHERQQGGQQPHQESDSEEQAQAEPGDSPEGEAVAAARAAQARLGRHIDLQA
jgi:hypothetical protein